MSADAIGTLFFPLTISETCPFGSEFPGAFRVDTVSFFLIDCFRCEPG